MIDAINLSILVATIVNFIESLMTNCPSTSNITTILEGRTFAHEQEKSS